MFVEENLKFLRLKKSLSYRQLEKLSGVTYSVICNIEKHRIKDPSLSSVIQLAHALEIDMNSFLFIKLDTLQENSK